jgi:trimethylamine:corrinoid methyltransferase-like protein
MKYQINADKIIFTQLGDEGVVLDIEKNEYVSLNETLFKILKGIEQSHELEIIVSNLCQEYAITEEKCTLEVNEALQKLAEKKYII